MEVIGTGSICIRLAKIAGIFSFFDRRDDDARGLNEGECFEWASERLKLQAHGFLMQKA